MKFRLVEVATGKVKHSGEFTQQAVTKMYNGSAPEMQAKVIKPLVDQVVDSVSAVL